jgi:hypothetical protein
MRYRAWRRRYPSFNLAWFMRAAARARHAMVVTVEPHATDAMLKS